MGRLQWRAAESGSYRELSRVQLCTLICPRNRMLSSPYELPAMDFLVGALSCFFCSSCFCFVSCCCLFFSLSFLPPLSPMAPPFNHYDGSTPALVHKSL